MTSWGALKQASHYFTTRREQVVSKTPFPFSGQICSSARFTGRQVGLLGGNEKTHETVSYQ